MKTLFNKVLAMAILAIASSFSAYSQTRDIEHDLSEFDSINVSGDFKVSFSASRSYSVKLTVDDVYEPCLDCYVKGKCLYIAVDEKKLPKDAKKQYKAKNVPDPVFRAVIHAPVLSGVTLNDASSMTEAKLSSESLTIELNGAAKMDSVKLKASSVTLRANKKASFSGTVASSSIIASGDGNASFNFDCGEGQSLELNAAGSSNFIVDGDFEDVKCGCSNNSQTVLAGSANNLLVTGKAFNAKVDANALITETAKISASGPEVIVKPVEVLELDLGKGTVVTYYGDPVIKIINVQNASISRVK